MSERTKFDIYGGQQPYEIVQISSEIGDFSVSVERLSDRLREIYETDETHEIVINLTDFEMLRKIRIVTPDGDTHQFD